MDIAGNKTHNVIAWGGGFNIGKDASVNFTTSHGKQGAFLNLDYTNKASQILGTLNGGTNSIYLVNPSGVLIGKDASINANKFGVSTSVDNDLIEKFKNDKNNNFSFSPAFKPNKGDIVNMGTINANEIVLVGNKVEISNNEIGNNNASVQLIGKDIVVPINLRGGGNNKLTAFNSISTATDMTAFEQGGYSFTFGNFSLVDYISSTGEAFHNKVKEADITKYLTIDSVGEWAIFADAWNKNRGDTRKIAEFRLIDNIDFQGAFKPEYMIGHIYNTPDNSAVDFSNAFTSIFNGNGYTLSNIVMDIRNDTAYKGYYAGIFGGLNSATIKNLNIKNVDIKSNKSAGGLGAFSMNSNFYDIAMDGVKVYTHLGHAGGMLARTYGDDAGKFERIKIENINIDANQYGASAYTVTNAGGFIAIVSAGHFNDIFLNNIEKIESGGMSGGFGAMLFNENYTAKDGKFKFENIKLTNVGKKNDDGSYSGGIQGGSWAGGFFGQLGAGDSSVEVKNIYMDNIYRVSSYQNVGGFAETFGKGSIENVYIGNIGIIESTGSNGVEAGGFLGNTQKEVTIKNITIDNIEEIIFGRGGSQASSGGFIGRMYESGTLENIAINNIGKIQANGNSFGVFIGALSKPNVTIKNVIMNNIGNITCQSWRGCDYVDNSGFIGDFKDNSTFEDIYIFFSGNDYSGINNLVYDMWASKNATFKDFYMYYNEKYFTHDNFNAEGFWDNKYEDRGIAFIKYTESELGDRQQSFIAEAQSNTGIVYDNDLFKASTDFEVKEPELGHMGEYTPEPITLDKNDFSVEVLKLIINDILNNDFILNLDDSSSLESILNGMDLDNLTTENIQTILMALLVNGDEAGKKEVLESIKQSLEFYAEFNKGETDGLKAEFEKWYGNDSSSTYNSSMDKYNGIVASIETLKNYVNGTLKPKLESIQSNLNRFESLKAEIARLDKEYQEALENKLLPYDRLEAIYKDTKEKIDAYYTEAEGLLVTLGGDNDFLKDLIGTTYDFKDKYNDVTGSFSFVGSDIESSINGGLGDKPTLTPPDNNDSGNDQTIDGGNSAEIANALAKQADLASKEAVITLPAQEREGVVTEDERELGRACIVSDNAKTNNPCIATSF